ncbi:MAG: hypothetical protein ACTHY8_06785 [Microbacterium gubbeenense]|uniref:hypothetical protein n=1 Tax=Microbacterium gubbeenense TaxID=159896 RepID=UPI003F986205
MTNVGARRIAAAAVALVMGITAFAGCSRTAPTVPEESSPSASVGTSPFTTSPTPTPEEIDPDDPADPDSWVITDSGIGPVNVGDDFPDVLDEIKPSGIGTLDTCDGVAYGVAEDNAYDVIVIKDRFKGTDDVVEVSVGWIGDTMGVGPRTEEDLGLGSTKAQVLGAYEKATEQPSDIADNSYVVIDDETSKLVFTYRDGYDGAVAVSTLTGKQPSYEPCA